MKLVSTLPDKGTGRGGIHILLLVCLTLGIAYCFSGSTIETARADKQPFSFNVLPAPTGSLNSNQLSYFPINTQMGKVVQNSLQITNTSDTSGSVRIYPLDTLTAANGGFIYADRQQATRNDVGGWITLSSQQVTLGPGESRIVPFQVKIPAHTRTGQHIGGVAVEDMKPSQTARMKTRQIHIDVIQRIVLSVQVSLPGAPDEKLSATSLQFDKSSYYQRLLIGLHNNGNVVIQAKGTLRITDLQGQHARTQVIQIGKFVPQTSIEYPVYILQKMLPIGRYRTMLTLNYGRQHTLNYASIFTVEAAKATIPNAAKNFVALGDSQGFFSLLTPWQIVLLGAVALLVIAALLFSLTKLIQNLLRMMRKRKTQDEIPASVESTASSRTEPNIKSRV